MKTLSYHLAAWFLVLGGVAFILFSPWMILKYQRLVTLIEPTAVFSFNENELLLRIMMLMLVGVMAVLTGVHLRQIAKAGF